MSKINFLGNKNAFICENINAGGFKLAAGTILKLRAAKPRQGSLCVISTATCPCLLAIWHGYFAQGVCGGEVVQADELLTSHSIAAIILPQSTNIAAIKPHKNNVKSKLKARA